MTLGVVKVGRDSDYRLGDGLAEIVLGGFLHFHQHARRDLRRRHLLVVDSDPGVTIVGADDLVGHHFDIALHDVIFEATPDQALDGKQGVLGVGHRLAFCRLADQDLTIIGVGHDGGRGAITLAVFDNAWLVALHDSHAGVGGPEVYTDNLTHDCSLRSSLPQAGLDV